MELSNCLVCPSCGGKKFTAKYEASYVYSYIVDSDAPKLKNDKEFLSFLFENREQKDAKQYIECNNCKERYPCSFGAGTTEVELTILRKAVRADHVNNPEFLG